MDFREDYVERLRGCLQDADDWYAIERCFREPVADDEIDDARPIVFAFGYMLVTDRKEQLQEHSGIFAPQFVIQGAIFPAPLSEIPEEMLPLWAAYAEVTNDLPLAASRFNDLLWVRRYGERAVDHAAAAIDAYLTLADGVKDMDLVDCLLRAIQISREIKDPGRLQSAVERAMVVAEEEMGEEEWRPGIPLNLLEAIVELKSDSRPEGLEDLLQTAGVRYANDPFIAQAVSELKVAVLPEEEREQLQLEQVERWREQAKKTTGLLRYSHLQQAHRLARTHDLREIADAILVEIQSMTPDDLELKRVSAEVKVPRAEIDAYVQSFATGPDSWQEALARFGAQGPPSGDVAANAKFNEEMAERYPLARILTTQVLGERSSLTFSAEDEAQQEKHDASQHEALRIRLWAPIGVEILAAIAEKFGHPDRKELVEFFTTDLIDREVATRIADGLLRFFDGDDDGALHILVPQIEAAIRGAAARLGIVVIRNPKGERPGGVRQLGALLHDFEGRLDESWRRYLVNALTDSLGFNLRDNVSHGLYGPVVRADVGIAVHIACFLQLWKPVGEDGQPEGTNG